MTLPTSLPAVRLTDRDLDILAALNFGPLTAQQLLKLSRTFAAPFTDERRIRERLFALAAAGRVRRWLYATAGPGAPAYYTLTRLGHHLLHGADAPPPRRHALLPIGVARQFHTHALAEFVVHTLVAAHLAGADVCSLARENDLRLTSGGEDLVPDAAFLIRLPTGNEFSYYVEIDCATERIRSTTTSVSWERKARLYEQLQDATPQRFRVLAVVARSPSRVSRILGVAAKLAKNPHRSLVCAATLADYLAAADPLRMPLFRDHLGRAASLVPTTAATISNADGLIP